VRADSVGRPVEDRPRAQAAFDGVPALATDPVPI
jgi:hypothetical protein